MEEDIPLPSKSEIIRQELQPPGRREYIQESSSGKHDPIIEKPSKAFSIKDVISEDNKPDEMAVLIDDQLNSLVPTQILTEFSPEAFEAAWIEFTDQLKGEGPRIISMLKSIKPEFENDQTIKIHLSNAAQKDTFILNYKPKLVKFLEGKFIMSGIDIETTVDISEAVEPLYSDEQKFNYLADKYPVIKEMKRTFNLDIT